MNEFREKDMPTRDNCTLFTNCVQIQFMFTLNSLNSKMYHFSLPYKNPNQTLLSKFFKP